MTKSQESNSFRAGLLIKWGLTLLVIGFVVHRASDLLRGADFSAISISPLWLALSCVCYGIAWIPSIWFWRGLLQSLGQSPGWILSGKAYFAGHLGKYVPGKAGVLLLRSGVLKQRGHAFGAGVITSTYETLVVMGVGLLVACSLAPMLVSESQLTSWSNSWGTWIESRWAPGAFLCLVAFATVPVTAKILSRIAFKLTPEDSPRVPIRSSKLLSGYLAFFGCWGLLGLSLGAALQSVSSDPLSLGDWPLWTAAVSASTVLGFFAIFAPGGLGVRESVLMEILRLQPTVTPQEAVLGTVLLRVMWIATEAALYFLCWFLERRQHSETSIAQ